MSVPRMVRTLKSITRAPAKYMSCALIASSRIGPVVGRLRTLETTTSPPITAGSIQPIVLINDVPMTLLAKLDFPAKDIRELIAYVKQNAAKITLANAGIGSASHLCGLMFMSALDQQLTPVPYKGTAPAMTDLMGGQVDILCDQTTNTTEQIKSGKVKVIMFGFPELRGGTIQLATGTDQFFRFQYMPTLLTLIRSRILITAVIACSFHIAIR